MADSRPRPTGRHANLARATRITRVLKRAVWILCVAVATSIAAPSLAWATITQYPVVSQTKASSGPGTGGTVYTWSNGLFRRVPPKGFNFATATPEQRQYYGIPGWEKNLSDITIAAPSGPLIHDSSVKPPGSYTTSYNWAGPQVSGSPAPDGTFWSSVMYYYEPQPYVTPYSTSDPCRSYSYEGDYIWSGIGNGASLNDNLFQDGTFVGYYKTSNGGAPYYNNDMWVAFYPTFFFFSSDTANPGDYVEAAVVDWGPNSTGYDQLEFYVYDETTGVAYPYWYSTLPQYFNHTVAEGIVEHYGGGLSGYATLDFGSASAPYNFAYPGPPGNYGYLSFDQLPWLDREQYGVQTGQLNIYATAPGSGGSESWYFYGCN